MRKVSVTEAAYTIRLLAGRATHMSPIEAKFLDSWCSRACEAELSASLDPSRLRHMWPESSQQLPGCWHQLPLPDC